MSSRTRVILGTATLCLLLTGCSGIRRAELARQSGGNAALFGQFAAYDGYTGRPISFDAVLRRCRAADVLLFGESHSDAVCNQIEAQLLAALATDRRPVCLAMEFLEADIQAALDAYLAGRVAEDDFRELTRQGRAYVLSHRPLIELCRSWHVPVVAANAPRRLVRGYRKSGLTYDEYRAGLEAEQQRWLPVDNAYLTGPYEERFFDLMGGHGAPPAPPPATQPTTQPTATTQPTTAPASQPATMASGLERVESFYRAQLLWDEAMADALAGFRAHFSSHRVMLIVGSFHVAHAGGTATKFRQRRPEDRVVTITYRGTEDGRFAFDPDDRGAGDVVIYGIVPPPERERDDQPSTMPAAMPATAPASQPAATPETRERPTEDESAAEAESPREQIVIRTALVIGQVGRYGRAATHTDAVEARIVAGRWTPPSEGRELTLPDGSTRTWENITPNDKDWFEHGALRGGYAYAAVESDRARVMLLEARGHGSVYVNGHLRVGDPYRAGFVGLPVRLREGTNHLLFVCGRGGFSAKLIEPRRPVALDARDATLPDLIVGEDDERWAAVVVCNATEQPVRDAMLVAELAGTTQATPVPTIPAMTVRKIAFRIAGPAPDGEGTSRVELLLSRSGQTLDSRTIELRRRRPDQCQRRTFISDIDGSVQFYALQPAHPAADDPTPPALFLSVHGADVDALRQASCYANKTWGHVVAPTNRRPYGFDWEDWGRLDALEVLGLAERELRTDPRRTYLTGHSMGGHGTWQLGAHYPDRFAAIAPSAGWISFRSYTGAASTEAPTPIEQILRRAANPSDTLALSRNYLQEGIYILHGDADDNVPVDQARQMRAHLADYHPNFAYYERPGAGHWWGDQCMDWPPLFEFLKRNTKSASHEITHIEFVTTSPAISAKCHWVTIEQQLRWLEPSRIDLRLDRAARTIAGTTENVGRLMIALRPDEDHFILDPGEPLSVELDGQSIESIPWPDEPAALRLARTGEDWQVLAESDEPDALLWQKGPHRAGPFKEAFQHRVQFVYGTGGTPEENAWALAKARYDAETFWYRGNGSIDVLPDGEFDPDAEPDRGVVLYGNADSNSAWAKLFGASPVQVRDGAARVADREMMGDDLAVLAVYPRPGSDRALVAVVGGTGLVGMRLTERLPYFVSGVAYPDWIVMGPEVLTDGTAGVRGAGFFDSQWAVDEAQSAWSVPGDLTGDGHSGPRKDAPEREDP